MRIPVDQWDVYRAEAARRGLSGNAYLCSVLARAHGLELVEGQADVGPQLALAFDGPEEVDAVA